MSATQSSPARSGPTGATSSRATSASTVDGPTASLGKGTRVTSPIVALHPTDGIFLRAEHLDQMQAYTRTLGAALGASLGSGVVHGYGATLDADAGILTVQAGLAVNAEGGALQSATPASITLAGDALPQVSSDGFYVLEVAPAPQEYGTENTYGAVCAEPCGGGNESSVAPWTMLSVALRLRGDELPGLATVAPPRQRSWLASQYFERERSAADPWLMPGLARNQVPDLGTRPWDAPRAAAAGRAVPLALLAKIEGRWVLDVWAARRDLGTAPGTRTWQDRLAMRPWSVYVAQVLQFHDQLGDLAMGPVRVQQEAVVDERTRVTESFVRRVAEGNLARYKDIQSFLAAYEKAAPAHVLADGPSSLADLGFDELPPAGYLPYGADGEQTRARVRTLFSGADVRFCRARADHVVRAVAAAQHLDRIPLVDQLGRPQVDILLPLQQADLRRLQTEEYGWLAFVRRSDADCDERAPETPQDPVDVLMARQFSDNLLEELREGSTLPPGVTATGITLAYPAGDPRLPDGVTPPTLDPQRQYRVIGVATSTEQEELMSKRADLVQAAWAPGGAAVGVLAEQLDRAVLVMAPEPDA